MNLTDHYAPMRILLTGGTGFIGSYVLQRLAAQRAYELFVAVRPSRDWSPAFRARPVPWDLRTAAIPATAPAAVDAVIHLAQANVPFPDSAAESYAVNAAGTLALLAYARCHGACKFIFASSGSVYGYGDRPFREDDRFNPADFYALTKAHAEQLVDSFQPYFTTCVLRLFAPYGPGQTGRLIPGLIARVRDGRPITLRDGGRPRFNPIFIADVLDVLEQVLALDDHHTLNVGGDQALSIREMAEIIGQELGRTPIWEHVPGGPPGDVVGDTRRLRRLLGPRRLVPFREGIRLMLRERTDPLTHRLIDSLTY